MAQIEMVGVVGCGLMGHGIVQVAAEAGYQVISREVDQAALDLGIGRIERQLARAVEKGRTSREDAAAVRARIEGTTDYSALVDCDLIIEAITENLGRKREMWSEVDAVAKPAAIFATNTSSLGVIAQASATDRPDRFLGLHFFNPPQVMKLLEVARCVATTDETLQAGLGFGERLGKEIVSIPDKPGLIVNRLITPYMLDGMRAYEEGVGSIAQIDIAMKVGAGHPMGPLMLSDLIGLDTIGSICEVMFDQFRERRFAAPPTLRMMLDAGWYGKKSGMGFYDYSGDEPVENPGLA